MDTNIVFHEREHGGVLAPLGQHADVLLKLFLLNFLIICLKYFHMSQSLRIHFRRSLPMNE